MKQASHQKDARETLQSKQEELLKRAMSLPGVAAAVEAYSRLEPYATAPRLGVAAVRFSTGGNQ